MQIIRFNLASYATDWYPIWNHQLSGKWHNHGGWNFAVPPELTSSRYPAIWRAADAPSVIIFHYNSGDGVHGSIQPILDICDLLQDIMTSEGRHLVLENQNRRHRVVIKSSCASGNGYFVLRDGWLGTRLSAIERFEACCRPPRLANLRDFHFPTAYQKHRLILMLNVLDAFQHENGRSATIRELAQNVLFRHADLGRAIEWKSSSPRRQTQRLLNEARYFVHVGYRLLLKQNMQKGRLNR